MPREPSNFKFATKMTTSISENLLPTVQSLLQKHLQISSDHQEFIQKASSWEELQAKLSALMQYLLQHDFERLLQGVYQIDVHEQKFKKAMQTPDLTQMADELAALILEREIQKAKFRQFYQSQTELTIS